MSIWEKLFPGAAEGETAKVAPDFLNFNRSRRQSGGSSSRDFHFPLRRRQNASQLNLLGLQNLTQFINLFLLCG